MMKPSLNPNLIVDPRVIWRKETCSDILRLSKQSYTSSTILKMMYCRNWTLHIGNGLYKLLGIPLLVKMFTF